MGVLVFAEAENGQFKKAAFEAVYYGYRTAQTLGTELKVLCLGEVNNPEILGNYGASKIFQAPNPELNTTDSQVYAKAISDAALSLDCDIIILSLSYLGRALAGRIAVRLDAGCVSGVNGLPNNEEGFVVSKSVFSGKAIEYVRITSEKKVLAIMGNAVSPETVGLEVQLSDLELQVNPPKVKVTTVEKIEGTVPLPEAELVVSAGRGVKDPANWGIIEELANELGASLACSRPVADAGWRPHHEHVGQTGIAIRPKLYIAIGISGAIQHLAGVNNSKVIVVINKDPEAPFFKAADYGVVGDLFDVVPRLNDAVRRFKAS